MSHKGLAPQVVLLFAEALVLLVPGTFLYLLISRVAGADLLGLYSLVLAWLVLFQAVANFGLPELLMRDIGRDARQAGRYTVHGLAIGGAMSLVAVAAMIVVVQLFRYPADLRLALVLGALALPPIMVTAVSRAVFLAHSDARWIVLVALAETLVVIPVNSYFVLAGRGIVSLVATMVAGKVLAGVLCLLLLHRFTVRLHGTVDRRFARSLAAPLVTFFASNLLGLLSLRVNVVMLSMLATMGTVGVYAAASKVIEIGLIVPSVFAQILLPRVSRALTDVERSRAVPEPRMLRALFALVIALGGGLFFFAGPLVRALFGTGFEAAIPILRVLVVYFVLETAEAMMGMMLKAAGHQRGDVRMYCVNVGVNVVANLGLVPLLGGMGAALAKLAGSVGSGTLRTMFISSRLFDLRWSRIAGPPLVLTIALIAGLSALQPWVPTSGLLALYVMTASTYFWLSFAPSMRSRRVSVRPARSEP